MQAQEPRKASTRWHEDSWTCLSPPPKKARYTHSAAIQKKLPRSPRSIFSSHPFAHRSVSASCSQLSFVLIETDGNMKITITFVLPTWLTDSDLEGFIKVTEAPAHTNSIEVLEHHFGEYS